LKLEVVVVPVSDVDRAKRFYASLGWRLDADFVRGDIFRVVQFTPPGSPCAIQFGRGATSAAWASAQTFYLVVSDMETARAALIDRGANVSSVFHRAGPKGSVVSGPDPQRRSHNSFAAFKDPDGNSWLLQEVREQSSERIDSRNTTITSSTELAAALRRAALALGGHERRNGENGSNWSDRYAEYIVNEHASYSGQGDAGR
jgi:catechol 2,3-dioxygenase-like lactoylglutathione lyase family enzyme